MLNRRQRTGEAEDRDWGLSRDTSRLPRGGCNDWDEPESTLYSEGIAKLLVRGKFSGGVVDVGHFSVGHLPLNIFTRIRPVCFT